MNMSVKPHFFIGIPFPAELAEPLYHSISSRPELAFHKWVHALDYHFTLVFLGPADSEQLSDLEEGLSLIASDTASFELRLRKTGTFGKPSEPRILYVEPEYSAALFELRERVKQAAAAAGFEIEKRPFRPHMTVARKWNGADPFNGRLDPLDGEVSFTARNLTVFQTHLDKVPKYEHKAVFPFGTQDQAAEM